MISSGVEPFHRGDETITCGLNFRMSSRPSASWNRNKYVILHLTDQINLMFCEGFKIRLQIHEER